MSLCNGLMNTGILTANGYNVDWFYHSKDLTQSRDSRDGLCIILNDNTRDRPDHWLTQTNKALSWIREAELPTIWMGRYDPKQEGHLYVFRTAEK